MCKIRRDVKKAHLDKNNFSVYLIVHLRVCRHKEKKARDRFNFYYKNNTSEFLR